MDNAEAAVILRQNNKAHGAHPSQRIVVRVQVRLQVRRRAHHDAVGCEQLRDPSETNLGDGRN